ncbi:MAG: 5-oxoprolinase subunit B family protein [Candidatus Dormibacteria bacterium]
MKHVTWAALGDAAVAVRWGRRTAGPAAALEARAAAEALDAEGLAGVIDIIPGPVSILLRLDPRRTSPARTGRRARDLVAGLHASAPCPPNPVPASHRFAVRYGGDAGPDLDDVAGRLGISAAEVVRRHAAARFTVVATGFAPGFVYLASLPIALRLPRRDSPRPRVPPGSVAIAASQSGIYGVATAGGWWLIGRTQVPVFNPRRLPPTSLAIGDRVQFWDADSS